MPPDRRKASVQHFAHNEDHVVGGAAISVRGQNGKFTAHETASSMCAADVSALIKKSNAVA
jgi:hypothetical protein